MTRWRVLLPIVNGVLALALMVWDIHNQRVITSMGMAWDTGAPVWPYRTSQIALIALNAPAWLLGLPVFFLFQLYTAEARYPAFLAILIAWWWWVGARFDYGLIGNRAWKHPYMAAAFLFILAGGLLFLAVIGTLAVAEWWFKWGEGLASTQAILLLKDGGPVLWCIALGCAAIVAGTRLIQYGKHGQSQH